MLVFKRFLFVFLRKLIISRLCLRNFEYICGDFGLINIETAKI